MTEIGKVEPLHPLVPYDPYAIVESPPPFPGAPGLRSFANPKTQAAIEMGLAELGEGETVAAVVHHIYNQHGDQIENESKVSIVVRLPYGFSVMAGAFKDWQGGDQGVEGKITFSR
jgi:hypothetical protein